MALKGIYAEMFTLQAQMYLEHLPELDTLASDSEVQEALSPDVALQGENV